MIYRNFQGEQISQLAFGAMRLPVLDGDMGKIDYELAKKMVDYAYENGVNYFDTAYGYHNGESQVFLGKALAEFPRNTYFLANKFPGYDLSKFGHVAEVFEEQLKKCATDYFDFYLFHNVCEQNIEKYLQYEDTYEYLVEQKKNGRIKHLGISAHGSVETIKRFLEKYGDAVEFCQLQLNWIDWDFQDAKGKVALLAEYEIPVWVMEPLRGGMIAKVNPEALSKLETFRPGVSAVEWSYRWLQSVSGVVTILSGASTLEQVQDNVRAFTTDEPTTEEESAALMSIAADMVAKTSVPCTACAYCTSYCPQGINIPRMLELYNEDVFTGGGFIAPMAISQIEDGKKPGDCIGCRSCEAVCPQGIAISEVLADFAKRLDRPAE